MINRLIKPALLATLLAIPALSLPGCGCGFDCNSGNNGGGSDATTLTLGFSDSLPEELKQVVIEVNSITLRPNSGDDVVIDSFTIEELNLTDADTFQIDLLDYRGVNQLVVISDLEIDSKFYSEVQIAILDDGINNSYILENDDEIKQLLIPGPALTIQGADIESGIQAYTVEFGLAQSLSYQVANDTYLLSNEGIRLENTNTAASLSGQVDSALFDAVSPCDEKTDPETGNRIYIYEGANLGPENLGDVYTSASSNDPAGARAPFAVAALAKNSITGNWDYAFGYLPPGDYTLAFACDTEQDGSVDFDGLSIPLPTTQVYTINLSSAERAQCNIAEEATCS